MKIGRGRKAGRSKAKALPLLRYVRQPRACRLQRATRLRSGRPVLSRTADVRSSCLCEQEFGESILPAGRCLRSLAHKAPGAGTGSLLRWSAPASAARPIRVAKALGFGLSLAACERRKGGRVV